MALERIQKTRSPRKYRVANPPVPIPEIVPYIDTIHLLLPHEPSDRLLRLLKEQCGSVHTSSTKFSRADLRLHVNQPSLKALRAIAKQYSGKRIIVSELHLALDLCTHTQKDAKCLGRWLNRRLVHRWHRMPSPACWVRGTRYTSTGRVGTNGYVVYSDLESKITSSACCHVEWRAKGSRKVSDLNLNTLDLVLQLDHRRFWTGKLILERINKQAILRQTLRHIKKSEALSDRVVCNRARRVVSRLLRAAVEDPEGEALVTAHGFRCAARSSSWIDLRYAVARLDASLLLPAPSLL